MKKFALFREAQSSSRSVFSLLVESMSLRFSVGRIGLSEYLDFRLHLNDLTFKEKMEFGGWRAQTILEDILVDDYSRFLSLDKVTMYSLMRGLHLPFPAMRAVYGSKRPQALLNITSVEDLADYFRNAAHLPVYIKPAFGSYGRGNTLVVRADQDSLLLGDGSFVSIENFCRSLDIERTLGWILQEPLNPHVEIFELCGSKISGVRVHTFLTPDGPELVRAVFKINAGKEDSDNFQNGATGNLAAAIDIETGRVVRAVAGTGAGQTINPVHPVTGREFVGFQLPHWDATIALVREAHLAFPGFICPGWDIAICDDGPKILEINYFGDLDLPQHASRVGFLDDRFMGFMRSRGLDQLLTGNGHSAKKSNVNGRLGLRKDHWHW